MLSFAEFRAAAERLPEPQREAAFAKWRKLMKKEAGCEVQLYKARQERAEHFQAIIGDTKS